MVGNWSQTRTKAREQAASGLQTLVSQGCAFSGLHELTIEHAAWDQQIVDRSHPLWFMVQTGEPSGKYITVHTLSNFAQHMTFLTQHMTVL